MDGIKAVVKDAFGLALALWWGGAGAALLVFVVATTPYIIDNSEKARWLPLAYLIWGMAGCVGLVIKASLVAQRYHHITDLIKEKRATK